MTDQNPELTDEAKAEIAAAIAIVREDRILKYMSENRTVIATDPPVVEPPVADAPVDPNKPTPPPLKDPEPPKPKKRGVYWGDTDGE